MRTPYNPPTVVQKRVRGKPPEIPEAELRLKVFADYQRGDAIMRISTRYHIRNETVGDWLREAGLLRTPSEGRALFRERKNNP